MASLLSQVRHYADASPIALQLLAAVVAFGILASIYAALSDEKPIAGIPIMTIDGLNPKQSWILKGRALIQKGAASRSSFQVLTGTGPKVVLSNKYANEIRNHDSLSFNGAFARDFFPNYPGFDGPAVSFHPDSDDLIQSTVRMKLTQSLGLITEDLVEEATDSIHDIFGEAGEWQTIVLKEEILQLVARLSSRVFLGKELCREQKWLDIAKSYTIDVFAASRELRNTAPILRPLLHRFKPYCTRLRKDVKDARELITVDFRRRQAETRKAVAAGKKAPKTADAVGWMVELSKGKDFDLVGGQLSLSMAAIHTTTEAMTYALMDLCEHPEIIEPLRKEIVQVLSEHGWSKVSLYLLRLMDSFLKESQRMKSPLIALGRRAEKEVILSDGTRIPKMTRIMVETIHYDPEIYPDPHTFDVYRFYNKRQEPGQTNNWQYVSTDARHLGFGLGQHACPGRFFVANEIKIAMCHLLLKYDWRFVPGEGRLKSLEYESAAMFNPLSKLQVRRRREEMDLSVPVSA